MLSDFLEIPNLQQKSKDYLLGLVKRHVFRVKATQPLPPPFQRVELAVYGVLSTIYRIMGLPAQTEIRDPLDRPHALALGEPIKGV